MGSGELLIVSADDALPYERPPLSKGFLSGKENEHEILINSPEWYPRQGIDVKLQTVIESADLQNKRLRAVSGESFEFETLLIATGARARKLDCLGNDLPNVFCLRSLDDSRKIRAAAESSKRAVVLGGGFIGMEVASVLAQKNIETTLVLREDRVWSRVFTASMSEFFERYYTSRGVQVLKRENIVRLEGKDRVTTVVLSSGRRITCDLLVAGIGAVPVSELFVNSDLDVENGVAVNEYLETKRPGIFAAGDVANYHDILFNKHRRVEHWDNAVSQGQHWAGLVCGDRKPFSHVPYFFSDVFDLSYELWGDSEGATHTVARGDLNSSSFSVWWLKQDRLVSAFAMNRPDEERQAAAEWVKARQLVAPDRLADNNRAVGTAALESLR
jgi:NADPH-dependent 2,4-dienoyl-CoA reductase/sulfur reductase-like enzyme